MKPVLSIILLTAVATAVPHRVVPRQVTQNPGYTKLTSDEVYHLQNRGFGPTVPTPFKTKVALEEEEDEDRDELARAQSQQPRRPIYDDAYIQNLIPVQVRPQQRPQQHQQQVVQRKQHYVQQQQQDQRQQQVYGKGQESQAKGGKLEEEEEEEPDRLSILLPQSKFDCTGKNTGYYADEELNCEIFHYCQDNSKHSWICPEGFTFHQVHLICMPPGGDNICQKSSQFHFVNDYLYKPVNLEEHQSKPNVSLRYSDRYYPENYYNGNRYDEDGEEAPQQYQSHQRKPIQIGFQQVQQPQLVQVVRAQQKYSPTLRPDTTIGQVFRSPEEVNISLQQRRPQYVTQRYRDELGY